MDYVMVLDSQNIAKLAEKGSAQASEQTFQASGLVRVVK